MFDYNTTDTIYLGAQLFSVDFQIQRNKKTIKCHARYYVIFDFIPLK